MEDDRVGDKKLLIARSNKNIGIYVDSCDICQRMKNRTETPVEKLKLSEILEKL